MSATVQDQIKEFEEIYEHLGQVRNQVLSVTSEKIVVTIDGADVETLGLVDYFAFRDSIHALIVEALNKDRETLRKTINLLKQ